MKPCASIATGIGIAEDVTATVVVATGAWTAVPVTVAAVVAAGAVVVVGVDVGVSGVEYVGVGFSPLSFSLNSDLWCVWIEGVGL